MKNNEESSLIIYSDLSLEKVLLKFKTATVASEWAQSTYQQVFVGKIENNYVELRDTYGSNKNRILYKIQIFESEAGGSQLRIKSNHFERRQLTNAFIKAFLLPFGFVVLFLCFFFAGDEQTFLSALLTGIIMVLIPLLYKVKPLTKEEFLNEEMIQKISKLVSPTQVDIVQNKQV